MNKSRQNEIREYLIDNGAEMTRCKFHSREIIEFMKSLGYSCEIISHDGLYTPHLDRLDGEKMNVNGDISSWPDPETAKFKNIPTMLKNIWVDLQNRGLESYGIQLPLF